jgi:SAM-dependent methyltransferase
MKPLFNLSIKLVKKLVFGTNLLLYQLNGSKPWERGYFEHKWDTINRTINDTETIESFSKDATLPKNFGHRIDERIVEYPWVIANIPKDRASLLDAGSAINFDSILSHQKLTNKKITIANLNPETRCFWSRGISYIFGDMRKLPFTSDIFEIVTCISSLEHVGMDNTKIYSDNNEFNENKKEDYLTAVTELKRVLKAGGTLLITVPYGKYDDFGFFQQFDRNMVDKIKSLFDADKVRETYFKYENQSWKLSTANDCDSAEYITADKAKINPTIAVAASSVACLKFSK